MKNNTFFSVSLDKKWPVTSLSRNSCFTQLSRTKPRQYLYKFIPSRCFFSQIFLAPLSAYFCCVENIVFSQFLKMRERFTQSKLMLFHEKFLPYVFNSHAKKYTRFNLTSWIESQGTWCLLGFQRNL